MLTLEPEDIAYGEDRIKKRSTVLFQIINSPIKVLSSKRFKLFKVTPLQIKPKLLRMIVNSWALQVSLILCTLVIFFLLLDYRQEEAFPKSAYHIRVALFKGISMMFKNGIASAIVNF